MPLLITIALCGPSERHLHRTCCPMALQRSPKFRLRFKQPCPPRKDKCQSREHIARKAAVSEGLVPKARRPFALFLKEKSILKPGSSRLQYQKEMKKLGRAWKALLPAERRAVNQSSENPRRPSSSSNAPRTEQSSSSQRLTISRFFQTGNLLGKAPMVLFLQAWVHMVACAR